MTRLLAFVLLLGLGLGSAAVRTVTAQTAGAPGKVVYVVPIDGVVDLGLPHFVQRVLKEAANAGAAAVVLEVNTFGGRVDGAVQVRDALLDSPVRTIAYVNKRAISAGALITLAAETIVMAGGGTIGAATPVQGGESGASQAPVGEKAVSYVRSEFRATAERRKRPPALAEAMVDADIEIPGVVAKGKLLTLTTDEAVALKLADFKADTLESALAQAGLAGARIERPTPNWSEHLVRFLTHPVVSSLLITVATLGIILEMRTVGFGIAGVLGLSSLALFFWSHWLVQLAGWEELLLVLAGFTLLALEIFLIPGLRDRRHPGSGRPRGRLRAQPRRRRRDRAVGHRCARAGDRLDPGRDRGRSRHPALPPPHRLRPSTGPGDRPRPRRGLRHGARQRAALGRQDGPCGVRRCSSSASGKSKASGSRSSPTTR
jgi:membrane-bound serine protease (ClpP class)